MKYRIVITRGVIVAGFPDVKEGDEIEVDLVTATCGINQGWAKWAPSQKAPPEITGAMFI